MARSRREILSLGASAALASIPGLARASSDRTTFPRRLLRIAHITDMHVQPERCVAAGMEKCLEAAQAHHPDLIMMGGDQVMDCLSADRDRVRSQWDVYSRVLRANVGVPVEHLIGNHDVWGWSQPHLHSSESGFGKRYAQDRLEMPRPYRSFTKNGWHIIMLDSVHYRPGGVGYTAKLDEEQFAWLEDDLNQVPANRPVVVFSHIPIATFCAFLDGYNERSGNWHVPGGFMHIDARRIKDLFRKHPNVKACLAGHIHLVDTVHYLGVSYHCNGAASAGWWSGPFQECKNGYAIVDLMSDGRVINRYHEFDWVPHSV